MGKTTKTEWAKRIVKPDVNKWEAFFPDMTGIRKSNEGD
jgi:hypothetical protein